MASFVSIEIQTNDSANVSERRFPEDMLIADLKNRLEIITGASAGTMELMVHDTAGMFIATGDDTKCIGNYLTPGGEQKLQLRIKDTNALKLDDLSSVPKFELSQEAYESRQESLRAFKLRNKLGRFSENDSKRNEEEDAKGIQVGNRCEVNVKNAPLRRGQVMYVGKIGDKPDIFVGVRYDEPYGKNDGTFEGTRYFECPPKYGGFVKPSNVKVGDYPEDEIKFDE